jgi:hypothetical protein
VELQVIISFCEVELHVIQMRQEARKIVGSESMDMAQGDTLCSR